MVKSLRSTMLGEEKKVPYDVDSEIFQAVIGASDHKINKILVNNKEKIRNCNETISTTKLSNSKLEKARGKSLAREADLQAKIDAEKAFRKGIVDEIESNEKRIEKTEKELNDYKVHGAIAKDIRLKNIRLYATCTASQLHRSTGFHSISIWNGAPLTRLEALAHEANRCAWLENPLCPIPPGKAIYTSRRRVAKAGVDNVIYDVGRVEEFEEVEEEDQRESTSSYRNYLMWALCYPRPFDMPLPTKATVDPPSSGHPPARFSAPAGNASPGMATRFTPAPIDTATDKYEATDGGQHVMMLATMIADNMHLLKDYAHDEEIVKAVYNVRKRKLDSGFSPSGPSPSGPSPRNSGTSSRVSGPSHYVPGPSPRVSGPSPRFSGPPPMDTIDEEVGNVYGFDHRAYGGGVDHGYSGGVGHHYDGGVNRGYDGGVDHHYDGVVDHGYYGRPMKKPRGNPKDPSNYH